LGEIRDELQHDLQAKAFSKKHFFDEETVELIMKNIRVWFDFFFSF
jgi:hypothetical protein